MTDLYLRPIDRRKSRLGCFVLAGAAVLAAGILAWVWFRGPDSESTETEPAPETETTQSSTPPPPTVQSPAPPVGDPGQLLLRAAHTERAADRLIEARDKALQLLDESADNNARRAAEALLNEVNSLLIFSPRMMPEKVEYTIARGDSISKIASKFGSTVELVQRSNNVRGSLIRVGDRMRVFNGTFEVRINKTANDLVLQMNGRFFKRYRVGTGEFGTTPAGRYIIVDRIEQPPWWKDGKVIPFGHPDNLLGTHYLKLDVPGYGIHGTWEPDSIGFQSSAGCIRLLNDEIEELFVLLPVGVPVWIEE
jgi:lipoprotein-anchoring transpeptidase ErfK/SrfK